MSLKNNNEYFVKEHIEQLGACVAGGSIRGYGLLGNL
jgi:hypothetical protein